MKISSQFNFGILSVFAVSALANYSVLQATIKPQFDAIEIATSKMNHKRVLDALDGLQAKLRNSTQDWGFWDDTYDYVQGKRVKTYMKVNLSAPEEALDGLGIDTLAFINSKGSLIWAEAIDLSTKEKMPSLVEDIRNLNYKHPYLSGSGEARAASGIIKTSKGLMLAAAAPVIRSDRTGAPAGMLWMGRILDEPAVMALTGVSFRLEDAAVGPLVSANVVAIRTLDTVVVTSSLITDITGKPLVVLRAETPRDVSAAGATGIRSAIWLSMAAGAAVMLALWLLVSRVVVFRVVALKEHFATAGESGRLKSAHLDQSNDELGQLAKSFNGMAEQVNHLRDALADSSYLSGMSEWAAGTLHNVRNGLCPINVAAWRAQELFETPWVSNLKSALDQLKSPDTPAERREKLTAYVLTTAPQLLYCAEQVKVTSQEIISASKAVEDMVSGYEKFSRHEVEHEQIDLLPFINDVVKTAVTSQAADVQLSLPVESATIFGNRTLLRQILSNVFANAVEAMEGQSREKSIRVEWHDIGGADDNLRLSISDNGEGIALGHLNSIFQRGFSTRQHKVGGLGLHWCANAAKELGGSLTAESNGPGTGATLVLCLPTSKPTPEVLKETA